MNITDYCTQTELAELYGVTRNKIGEWLRDAGLRDRKGNPTNAGIGMTMEATSPNGYPFFVWHRESTIRLLDSLGHRRIHKYSLATPTYAGAYRPGTGERP